MTEPGCADKLRDMNRERITAFLMTAAIFAAASLIGYVFYRAGFPDASIALVYLLAVLFSVRQTSSFLAGLITSIAATFIFNYFFAEPRFTLTVNDPNYYVTFLTMTVTALVVSTLTARMRRDARTAREREQEAKAIYMLTNRLSDAPDMGAIAEIAAESVGEGLCCSAGCLCFSADGVPEQTYVYQPYGSERALIHREPEEKEALVFRLNHIQGDHDEGEEFFDWPLFSGEDILGVIRIDRKDAAAMDASQHRMLRSMIDSIALAMDRLRTSEQRIQSREEAVRERYRANLLRSISHDIRTPLTGIIGTSEMLRARLEEQSEESRMAEHISKDAEWLHSLVENILTLTRLQDQDLQISTEMEVAEEIVGGAVGRVAELHPEYDIEVELPEELLMAPMDAKLIEQVIINLLENSIKHSPAGSTVTVSLSRGAALWMLQTEKARKAASDWQNMITISVRDCGSGINENDIPHIFELFYSAGQSKAGEKRSFGLGLTICETIVLAHQGVIAARNREDGRGAEFAFSLPMKKGDDTQ